MERDISSINTIPCLARLYNFYHLFHPIYYISAGYRTTGPKSNYILLAHNRNGSFFSLKMLTGWKRNEKKKQTQKTRVVWWIWRKLQVSFSLKDPRSMFTTLLHWRREYHFFPPEEKHSPPLGSGMRQGCSCWDRGSMRGSAVDSEVNGSWERKDAWGWPCAHLLHSLSLLSLWCRGALPRARTGRGKIPFGCEGEQGEKHCRKLGPCVDWRSVCFSGDVKEKRICTQKEKK